MPGTKRTYSAAFPEESASKLVKRKSSIRVSASEPMPPALRRAPTLTVDDEEPSAAETGVKTLKSKRSSKKPSLLTKKSSSFVDEGVLVTKLSGLRSGSVVGETSLVASSSAPKKASLTKSKSALSKSESIRVSAVDETELSTAVSGLKSHLSKGGSKLSKKTSVVSVSSLSALEKIIAADNNEDASTSDGRADTLPLPPGGLMEVAVSFDTTGSMYGCLEEVRAKVQDLVQRLQADIPGIRIAVIAHGDYCDASNYIVKWVDFGASLPEICDFVKTVSRTFGGDGPECYELVLQRVREVLSWTPGSQRILVMIGDDEPHPVGYTYGGETYNIDWKEECAALRDMNVKIYGVQAGGGLGADNFNTEMARITGGCRLNLKNFSSIFDFLMMICYREANPEMLAIYQQEILDREGRIAADVTAMTKTFGVESESAPVMDTSSSGKKKKTTKKPISKISATKATKKETIVKKGVKAVTKRVKAKINKAKKATKKTSKSKKQKKAALRINKVQKREKLDDECMTKGPLKQLKWTDWECAIVRKLPRNRNSPKYAELRTICGYGLKEIFDDTFQQRAIYEVAVLVPGKRKKKYTMYMLSKVAFQRIRHWSNYILKHKNIREEVRRILLQCCSICIRRGVLSSKLDVDSQNSKIKLIEEYIRKNYDYAWNKYIWRRTTTESNGFNLRHRRVLISRGDTKYELSSNKV